ncbi:TPA: hypothetical protein H1016_04385 [archaeon]|uniref:Uncharacterized protein n=1 Tax=Candidatus Naiadarchaeum limnaeum TaxID=2756139 RepID=A0A832V5Q8_9ARCH|nr:hypothetical protein [Candidatus Naiadarchaeum limnaeum]
MASHKEIADLAKLVQDVLPQSDKKKRIIIILLKTGKFLTKENLTGLNKLVLEIKERLSELGELKKIEAKRKQILARMYDLDPIQVQGKEGNEMKAQIDDIRGRLTSLSSKLKNTTEEKTLQEFFEKFTNICVNAEEEETKKIEKGRKLEAELNELFGKSDDLRGKLARLNEELKKGEKVGGELAKIREELNTLYQRRREIVDELKRLGWG